MSQVQPAPGSSFGDGRNMGFGESWAISNSFTPLVEVGRENYPGIFWNRHFPSIKDLPFASSMLGAKLANSNSTIYRLAPFWPFF